MDDDAETTTFKGSNKNKTTKMNKAHNSKSTKKSVGVKKVSKKKSTRRSAMKMLGMGLLAGMSMIEQGQGIQVTARDKKRRGWGRLNFFNKGFFHAPAALRKAGGVAADVVGFTLLLPLEIATGGGVYAANKRIDEDNKKEVKEFMQKYGMTEDQYKHGQNLPSDKDRESYLKYLLKQKVFKEKIANQTDREQKEILIAEGIVEVMQKTDLSELQKIQDIAGPDRYYQDYIGNHGYYRTGPIGDETNFLNLVDYGFLSSKFNNDQKALLRKVPAISKIITNEYYPHGWDQMTDDQKTKVLANPQAFLDAYDKLSDKIKEQRERNYSLENKMAGTTFWGSGRAFSNLLGKVIVANDFFEGKSTNDAQKIVEAAVLAEEHMLSSSCSERKDLHEAALKHPVEFNKNWEKKKENSDCDELLEAVGGATGTKYEFTNDYMTGYQPQVFHYDSEPVAGRY